MINKILFVIVFRIVLLIVFCGDFGSQVLAVGSGNIDGGGGGLGQGSNQNFWRGGDDGVRVTVIRDSDNQPVTTPVDITNRSPDNIKVHFGKKSKIHYRNGFDFFPTTSTYVYSNPEQPIPLIVSADGDVNIDAVKSYFTDQQILKKISYISGFNYNTLIDGNYKLLLEPLAYITFNGIRMAMTAHEAALYDQKLSGELRIKMGSLTHKNLPMAMFLETSDLGYPAWNGPTDVKVSDMQIITSLGLGIVRFDKPDMPVLVDNNDYVYRVNTDVITSITLTATKNITLDDSATVNFYINDRHYRVIDIVIPEGESQIVWIKWHTPSTPQTINISTAITGNTFAKISGNLSAVSFQAKIVDLNEKLPPDPAANDKRPSGYSIPPLPNKDQKLSASWGLWSCYWNSNWVWVSNWKWKSNIGNLENSESEVDKGKWVDLGDWVDKGEWKYVLTNYTANLFAQIKVEPDDKVPFFYSDTMKSGYGLKISIKANLSFNAPSSSITGAQNAISYFPEFKYKNYLRVSDMTTGGYNSEFHLKPNSFSTYSRRVHFTPIWFPDGIYSVVSEIIDAWTPAGMLECTITDSVRIQDSLFDDWHISQKR